MGWAIGLGWAGLGYTGWAGGWLAGRQSLLRPRFPPPACCAPLSLPPCTAPPPRPDTALVLPQDPLARAQVLQLNENTTEGEMWETISVHFACT